MTYLGKICISWSCWKDVSVRHHLFCLHIQKTLCQKNLRFPACIRRLIKVQAISLLALKMCLFVSHCTAYIKARVSVYNVSTNELSHFDMEWYWWGGKWDGQIIYKEYMTVWYKNIIDMSGGDLHYSWVGKPWATKWVSINLCISYHIFFFCKTGGLNYFKSALEHF